MSTRLREKLAATGIGRYSNATGLVAPGATAEVDVPVPLGYDWVVATAIAFGGVTQVGPVTYELTNGLQDFSGYANASGDLQDVIVPTQGSMRLTVFNGLVGAISYNVLLIAMSDDDYRRFVRGANF